MAPEGLLENLALDIPLQATEKTRFQANWKDISWKQWELLPGVENLSGTLSGSVENGRVTVDMAKAKMPYATVFHAPLEKGVATLAGKTMSVVCRLMDMISTCRRMRFTPGRFPLPAA